MPHKPKPTRLELLPLENRITPIAATSRVLVTFSEVVPEAVRQATLNEQPEVETTEPIGFGIYRVNLRDGQTADSVSSRFQKLHGVLYTTGDQTLTPSKIPNDSSYTGQNWLNAINAPAAWDTATGTGHTIIAVIDTGIDMNHPDLVGNLWLNGYEIPGNGIDDDGSGIVDDIHGADFTNNTGNPYDTDGHGTHVAGIIGAVGNNGTGTSGVVWRTRIMPLKFMNADGGFTSNAVRAMNYAIDRGAKIINNSWGGGNYDPTLATAIRRAQSSGTIVVSSAGNQGANVDTSPFYPASYSTLSDNAVSVAATDGNGNIASYSNFGASTVTIAAPGSNILSTLPNSRYGQMSGTSMAAPVISGALALLWDAHPDWDYKQVIAKLKTSVDTSANLQGKVQTGGQINLAKLLGTSVSAPVTPPVTPPPTTNTGTGPRVLSSTFSGNKTGQFDRVAVSFNQPMDATSFTGGGLTLRGPNGTLGISAIIPISGTNNTQFVLMFAANQSATGSYTVTVNSTVRSATGTRMDQNANGTPGEAGDSYTGVGKLSSTSPAPVTPPVVPPPVAPPTTPEPKAVQKTFNAGVPRAIAAKRTTRVEINVNEDFTISSLSVALDASYARLSDLQIRLTAPNGQKVILLNRRSGSNLTATNFTDGGSALATTAAPYRGNIQPEQSLIAFSGRQARGLWVLEIFNLGDGVSGTLNAASLNFIGKS
jgi:serine protease